MAAVSGEVDQIEHVGGESESVAELFDEDAAVDDPQVGRKRVAHVHVHDVGQGDGPYHRPEPAPEAMARHGDASQNPSEGQSDDAERALRESDLCGGHAQPPFFYGVEQEGDSHFGQLRFGQAVKQHEKDGCQCLFLAEERHDGLRESMEDVRGGRMGCGGPVTVRTWQHERVVEPEGDNHSGKDEERDAPGVADASGRFLEQSGQHDEQSLSGNGGEAVERTPDAHEQGLLVGGESEHVEPVGGDVVCGRAERHEPEDGQCGLEEMVGGESERHARQSRSQKELHADNPPPFGSQQVDKRAPERLDDPGQVEPAGVERHVGIGNSHPLVHHQRQDHDRHVRKSFREIESGHPCPRRILSVVSHRFICYGRFSLLIQ